jgi:hypothetical protein
VVRLHPPRGIVKPLRLSSPCGDGPAGFGGVIRVSPQSPLLLFLGSAFHGPSSSLLPDSWVLLPSRCTRAWFFNRQFGWVFPGSLNPKEPTFQEHQTGRRICWTSTKSLAADGGSPMATIGPAGALGPCGETQAHDQVLFLGIVLKRSRWVFVEGRCLGGQPIGANQISKPMDIKRPRCQRSTVPIVVLSI